jgi:glycosyltransferase involved in cell wall biosynthesis
MSTHYWVRKGIELILNRGFKPDVYMSFNHPILNKLGEEFSIRSQSRHVIHIGHLMAESKVCSKSPLEKIKGYASLQARNKRLEKADQVWLMSEEMKKYFSSILNTEKMKVWPSAVAADIEPIKYQTKASLYREKLGIDAQDKVIVYIGTLSRQRGLNFVLNAFKILLEHQPKSKLLFLGYSLDSFDIIFLKNYAATIGVNHRVIFHPPVDEEELPYFVAVADVGISPFKPNFIFRHNSPLKLLEYFKAGIPVVANNIPEQKTVITESNAGLLVEWNEHEFANALFKILSLPMKDRIRMGYLGYLWVRQNRDIEVLTEEMMKWLKELEN